MTEKKRVETIELDKDPSLSWDIRKAADRLEYLLHYTPQYAEVLKTVRNLTAVNIEVTDEQQRCYANNERIAKDILQRIWEIEKEEEKDLPVVGRLEATHDRGLFGLVDITKGASEEDLYMFDRDR